MPHDYPAGLLEWAGHRKGGVRKPFFDGSGRPCADVFQTSLLRRLRDWARRLGQEDQTIPFSVFLIGGPGNGKTEAVEQVLHELDQALELNGKMVAEFTKLFSDAGHQSATRLVSVDLKKLAHGRIAEIAVVQDASMTDSALEGKTPADLLVLDIQRILAGSRQRIYLGCVNRGVLDDALMAATKANDPEVRRLLEAMIRSIELTPSSLSCWPLANFPDVAVWPMDVESLVEEPGSELIAAPAGQVLAKALDSRRWLPLGECKAGTRCPFCGSRSILEREATQKSLLRILRSYELALGKRWSFRDLFSLYSYLLAGAVADDSGMVNPCDWAEKQYALSQQPGSTAAKLRAPFVLVGALYQHALFGVWSRPNARQFRKDIADLGLKDDPGLNGLLYFLTAPRSTSIPATLKAQLAAATELLDPALAEPESIISLSSRVISLGGDIDTRFSQSVSEGLEQCRRILHPLEVDLLQRLAQTDERLSSLVVRQQHPATATRNQNLVRSFACRLVRRSLGVRYALVKDRNVLLEFQQVVAGEAEPIHKAVKQVAALLHVNGRFAVTLNSTFGEPALPAARRAVLTTAKQRIKAVEDDIPGRPTPPLRFIAIGSGDRNHNLPLTYDLFRAVRELERGMLPASLPRAVVALLDTTRSKLAGAVVRNEDSLEDSEIRLGTMNFVIRRELGQFVVSRDTTE